MLYFRIIHAIFISRKIKNKEAVSEIPLTEQLLKIFRKKNSQFCAITLSVEICSISVLEIPGIGQFIFCFIGSLSFILFFKQSLMIMSQMILDTELIIRGTTAS
jgi:hypothetical protein